MLKIDGTPRGALGQLFLTSLLGSLLCMVELGVKLVVQVVGVCGM